MGRGTTRCPRADAAICPAEIAAVAVTALSHGNADAADSQRLGGRELLGPAGPARDSRRPESVDAFLDRFADGKRDES